MGTNLLFQPLVCDVIGQFDQIVFEVVVQVELFQGLLKGQANLKGVGRRNHAAAALIISGIVLSTLKINSDDVTCEDQMKL